VQAFKKNILLYPADGDMAKHDPWLLGAEDWIRKPGGFEEHPHRGFQTITLVLEGALRHTDKSRLTRGSTSVVTAGDVQIMTAGRGVVHSEMPADDGDSHVMQIWLNLPRALKLMAPGHQDIKAKDIPAVPIARSLSRAGASSEPAATGVEAVALISVMAAGVVRVISGELNGVTGPARMQFPVGIYDVQVEAGPAEARITVPDAHRGFVYCISGEGIVSGTRMIGGQLGWLEDTAAPTASSAAAARVSSSGAVDAGVGSEPAALLRDILISVPPPDDRDKVAPSPSPFRLFVFTGQPHGEPVVSAGPFVMSTKEELSQAVADYRAGLF
jgi:redox-sensitive bicupin YhaK (pirin superfamily)